MNKTGVAYARLWHLVDANGQVLGRLARGIATTLQGQHKPIYTPSNDCGDHVVVINASKIVVSGKKDETKMYYSHSGYPGGLKEVEYKQMLKDKPEQIIWKAVYGMMPKTDTRKEKMRRVHIFADDKHPYSQNLSKSYEYDLAAIVDRKTWSEQDGSTLKAQHERLLRQKLVQMGADFTK